MEGTMGIDNAFNVEEMCPVLSSLEKHYWSGNSYGRLCGASLTGGKRSQGIAIALTIN
jgi:hypothetical protein